MVSSSKRLRPAAQLVPCWVFPANWSRNCRKAAIAHMNLEAWFMMDQWLQYSLSTMTMVSWLKIVVVVVVVSIISISISIIIIIIIFFFFFFFFIMLFVLFFMFIIIMFLFFLVLHYLHHLPRIFAGVHWISCTSIMCIYIHIVILEI